MRRAQALRLDISHILDQALETAVREAEQAEWLDQNRAAIDASNQRVAARGTFGERWRRS